MLAHVPSGWRNNPSQYQQVRYRAGDEEVAVEYQFQRGALSVRVNGEELPEVHCTQATPEQVRLQVGGVERSYDVQRSDDTYYIDSAAGSTELVEVPRFAMPEDEVPTGSLKAPLPGVVTEVKLRAGDAVTAGDVVLVIESMKVFHWIVAPLSGKIAELRVAAGNHVEGGMVLAVIDEGN